jgi:hypothetical protein
METKKRVMDMRGKFGNWTVLEKHGRQALCQCDCGTQKLVYSHTLTNGRSTNCGCERKTQSITVGTTFGRLTVISKVETKGKNGEILVLTQCSCEAKTQKYISKNSLKKGLTQSCGCLVRECGRPERTTHGRCNSHEYNSWQHIKRLCYNNNHYQYKYYGGYGIEVDPSWRSNFCQFLKDMGTAPEGTVISRIDTEGDFSPGNCLWIPRKEYYSQIHFLRRKEFLISQSSKPTITVTQNQENINFPQDIIQAVINAHAAGEANISKIANQHQITAQEVINIILYYA